ncbi:aldo/keto reductase [Aureivirga sp. CE67]|uniref:aldo/keto reductase n=1 Tax=Aureivirga sp. CE67 TaxID=1788983 RepID=UPI0018C93AF5|nr:aldo/keto reductase [Aureivirga sp. CE67]
MKYKKLPNTEIEVSQICLGTMTFGEQNTLEEAHQQLNYSLDKGVNFIDTAEVYAVPTKAETYGETERILGTWLKENRSKVVLASKIAGPNRSLDYIRPDLSFSKENLNKALEQSLERLQTDYLDIYQLHWPERKTNFFGKRGFKQDATDLWEDNFAQIIETLEGFKKEGKIRHFGVSNETPWGLMRFCEEARKNDWEKPITIQNPYSLLNRTFETGLAEISHREDIGLLAYSPLAFGILSGKYLQEQPDDARLTLYPQMKRYSNLEVSEVVKKYASLGNDFGISLAQLSLAFIRQQPFVTSTIIGATKMLQLKENIESVDVELSEELLNEIEKIHTSQPNPAP